MDELDDLDPEAVKILAYRAKIELRKRARALRNTIPESAIAERSARIRTKLEAFPRFVAAKRVALFWPIVHRNEVDLRPLVETLTARGVSIAFPSIDPETRVMTFRYPANPQAMEERGLGFAEPAYEDPEATELDVVIVPALGLDAAGNRIGYGAGFYDRTLPRFCPPALSIGVVFDFQLLAEVPLTDGDVPVHAVVTDERTFNRA
ncbi:MAG: 5-formyltetrahydrofolate cyclo-ligase [Polyangiaceae bacterium]|nr:5-formyltetrahydrofolate cyclo-ligase [Polyangiaceae bacterium]